MFSLKLLAHIAAVKRVTLSVEQIEALKQIKVDRSDFHDGIPGEMQTPEHTEDGCVITHFAELTDKTGLAVVRKENEAVVFFGRRGPTNFAKALIQVHDDVEFEATEFLFQWLKAKLCNSPNKDEVADNIYAAPSPELAKAAPRKLEKFDRTWWDNLSPSAMCVTILMALKNKATFDRYKSIIGLAGCEKVMFVECQKKDDCWAVKLPVAEFLPVLKATPKPDGLHAAMRGLYAEYGKNQLGELITEIMECIGNVTHEVYLALAEDIQVVEVVSDEPEAKRTKSNEDDDVSTGRSISRTVSDCF